MKTLSYKIVSTSPEKVEILAKKSLPIVIRAFLSMMAGVFIVLTIYSLVFENVPPPIGLITIAPAVFFTTIIMKGRAKKEIIHLEENRLVIEKFIGSNGSKQTYDIEKISQLRPTFNPKADLPMFFEFRNTMWNIPEGRITFNYEGNTEIKFAAVIDHEDAPFLIRDIKRFYAGKESNFA